MYQQKERYRNKQKNLGKKTVFCWRLGGHGRKLPDPDPLVKCTDPRIRIRTKMSRIHNTAYLA
jgi:hypothetical protein